METMVVDGGEETRNRQKVYLSLPIRHWTRVRVVVYGNYFRVYYDKNTDNRIELGNNFENVPII